jgi:hypothetical protein
VRKKKLEVNVEKRKMERLRGTEIRTSKREGRESENRGTIEYETEDVPVYLEREKNDGEIQRMVRLKRERTGIGIWLKYFILSFLTTK